MRSPTLFHLRRGLAVDGHRADVPLLRLLEEVGHHVRVRVLREELRRGVPAHVEVREVVRHHLVALAAGAVGDHADGDVLVREGLADRLRVEADDEVRRKNEAVASADLRVHAERLAVLRRRIAAVEVRERRCDAPEAVLAARVGLREGPGDALHEVREALGPRDEPAAVGGVGLDRELDLAQLGAAGELGEAGARRGDDGPFLRRQDPRGARRAEAEDAGAGLAQRRAGAPDDGREVGEPPLRDVDLDRGVRLDEDRRAGPRRVAGDGDAAALDPRLDDGAGARAAQVAADRRLGPLREDERDAALVAAGVGEPARQLEAAAVGERELHAEGLRNRLGAELRDGAGLDLERAVEEAHVGAVDVERPAGLDADGAAAGVARAGHEERAGEEAQRRAAADLDQAAVDRPVAVDLERPVREEEVARGPRADRPGADVTGPPAEVEAERLFAEEAVLGAGDAAGGRAVGRFERPVGGVVPRAPFLVGHAPRERLRGGGERGRENCE